MKTSDTCLEIWFHKICLAFKKNKRKLLRKWNKISSSPKKNYKAPSITKSPKVAKSFNLEFLTPIYRPSTIVYTCHHARSLLEPSNSPCYHWKGSNSKIGVWCQDSSYGVVVAHMDMQIQVANFSKFRLKMHNSC